MNKQVLDKVDEIIKLIEESDEYIKYLDLRNQINKNKELKTLINEVKVLQKDIVHKIDKKELLSRKMDELNNNPLYREYNNTLAEINNTYAVIENSLNKYFQDKLN